jgi:hypothetical protein
MTLSEQLRQMRDNVKDVTLYEAGIRDGLMQAIVFLESNEEPSEPGPAEPVRTVQAEDGGKQEESPQQEAAKEAPAERAPSKRRADSKGAGAAEAQG